MASKSIRFELERHGGAAAIRKMPLVERINIGRMIAKNSGSENARRTMERMQLKLEGRKAFRKRLFGEWGHNAREIRMYGARARAVLCLEVAEALEDKKGIERNARWLINYYENATHRPRDSNLALISAYAKRGGFEKERKDAVLEMAKIESENGDFISAAQCYHGVNEFQLANQMIMAEITQMASLAVEDALEKRDKNSTEYHVSYAAKDIRRLAESWGISDTDLEGLGATHSQILEEVTKKR